MNCNRKYSVYIDSSKRSENIGASNFEATSTSEFKYTINLPRGNKYSKVAVLQLEFPKSYYMIDSTNNSITLNEISFSEEIITIPSRNYTATQFATQLQTLLNTASAAPGMGTQTYTVTFDNTVGKFIITNTTGGTEFNLIDMNVSLLRYLGFPDGQPGNSSPISSSNVLTSTNVVNLQRYNSLYLRSNIVDEGRNGNVLQEMFMRNTNDFDLLSIQNNHSLNWKKCVQMDDQLYDFYITDINNKAVNLNGGEICVSLLFSE